MKTKKGLIEFAVIGIIALMGLLIVAVPGLAGSILSVIEAPKVCTNAPLASNCFCVDGTRKVETVNTFPISWFCEQENLMFDPELTNFNDTITLYAAQKFGELYPSCNLMNCDHEGYSWNTVFSYTYSGSINGREALVECRGNLEGGAHIRFKLLDGTVLDSGCSSVTESTGAPNNIEVILDVNSPVSYTGGSLTGLYSFRCQHGGPSESSVYTWNAPNGVTVNDASGGNFMPTGLGGVVYYDIVSVSTNQVKFKLRSDVCSQMGGTFNVPVKLTVTNDFLSQNNMPYCIYYVNGQQKLQPSTYSGPTSSPTLYVNTGTECKMYNCQSNHVWAPVSFNCILGGGLTGVTF